VKTKCENNFVNMQYDKKHRLYFNVSIKEIMNIVNVSIYKCKYFFMILLRPVDTTILFFRGNLVVVMILKYTRENRMRSICLQF